MTDRSVYPLTKQGMGVAMTELIRQQRNAVASQYVNRANSNLGSAKNLGRWAMYRGPEPQFADVDYLLEEGIHQDLGGRLAIHFILDGPEFEDVRHRTVGDDIDEIDEDTISRRLIFEYVQSRRTYVLIEAPQDLGLQVSIEKTGPSYFGVVRTPNGQVHKIPLLIVKAIHTIDESFVKMTTQILDMVADRSIDVMFPM